MSELACPVCHLVCRNSAAHLRHDYGIYAQSIGSIKLGSGGVSWNKSGGGKEIKIAAKGQTLPFKLEEDIKGRVSCVRVVGCCCKMLAALLISFIHLQTSMGSTGQRQLEDANWV